MNEVIRRLTGFAIFAAITATIVMVFLKVFHFWNAEWKIVTILVWGPLAAAALVGTILLSVAFLLAMLEATVKVIFQKKKNEPLKVVKK